VKRATFDIDSEKRDFSLLVVERRKERQKCAPFTEYAFRGDAGTPPFCFRLIPLLALTAFITILGFPQEQPTLLCSVGYFCFAALCLFIALIVRCTRILCDTFNSNVKDISGIGTLAKMMNLYCDFYDIFPHRRISSGIFTISKYLPGLLWSVFFGYLLVCNILSAFPFWNEVWLATLILSVGMLCYWMFVFGMQAARIQEFRLYGKDGHSDYTENGLNSAFQTNDNSCTSILGYQEQAEYYFRTLPLEEQERQAQQVEHFLETEAIGDDLEYHLQHTRCQRCPFCGKEAILNLYTSHLMVSLLMPIIHRFEKKLYCRRCILRHSLTDSLLTFLCGWWSTSGMFVTPFALIHNFQNLCFAFFFTRPTKALYVFILKSMMIQKGRLRSALIPDAEQPASSVRFRRDAHEIITHYRTVMIGGTCAVCCAILIVLAHSFADVLAALPIPPIVLIDVMKGLFCLLFIAVLIQTVSSVCTLDEMLATDLRGWIFIYAISVFGFPMSVHCTIRLLRRAAAVLRESGYDVGFFTVTLQDVDKIGA
jgi:hypothetical protein